MQIIPRQRLLHFAHLLQDTLFGTLEPEVGPLAEKARLLVSSFGVGAAECAHSF